MKKLLFILLCILAGVQTIKAQEAYVVYYALDTKLTFYYDDLRSSRYEKTYDLNTGHNNPEWYTDSTYASVTEVKFDKSFHDYYPTTTHAWFYNMENLQTVTSLCNLRTRDLTDMSWMFYNCKSLTSLDFRSYNIISTHNVTTMKGMFRDCSSLKSLDLRDFDTENVTDMSYMFHSCNSLTSLNLSDFNTEKVTHMDDMFAGLNALTTLDLRSFNTANVISMNWMFSSSNSLKTIYVSDDWNMSSVKYATLMFNCCFGLVGEQGTTFSIKNMDASYAHIDGGPDNPGYLSRKPQTYVCYTPENTTLTFYRDTQRSTRPGTIYTLNTELHYPDWYNDGTKANVTHVVFDPSFANARPTSTYSWFNEMKNLQSITGMEYLNTSKVTEMRLMFAECSCLTSLDLSYFNTAKVTGMHRMFYNCSNLKTIYVGNGWSTEETGSLATSMFENCTSLVGGQGTIYDEYHVGIEYAHIDGGLDDPGYFTADGSEPWVEAYACYTESNTTLTFYYDGYRKSHKDQTYDLNKGSRLPDWHSDETYQEVTHVVFDPSFAVARPTSTYSWFYEMENLQSIEGIEYLNTSEVTSMSWMFNNCSSLTSLDLSGFNTAKVKSMHAMFGSSESLTSLDLSNFNTAKVTDMISMFHLCTNLTWIDLSGFNTANVVNMDNMFYYCYHLQAIYVGDDWSTESVTDSGSMFYYCQSLMGSEGTTYDEDHTDASYAHVDGGRNNPGYLTHFNEPKAYTCYTPENTTLTFYYDPYRGKHATPTYTFNTLSDRPDWYSDGIYANVTKVVFDSSFAAVRPKTTSSWFYGMRNLQSITGMAYLNTSDVLEMMNMFRGCSSLTSLDLRDLNTAKVTNMLHMFADCSNLTNLDLSSFNTVGVEIMKEMFSGCNRLKTIYVGKGWSTDGIQTPSFSDYMFDECYSLKGGQGTPYDADHTDKEYAHIDGGEGNPGYFTAPKAFDYYVDGIYYKYDGYGTVVVVNDGSDTYGCYSGTLVIPEMIEYDGWWYKVTGIGERAFYRCPSLKKVVIPATVDVIDNEAFADAFSENLAQSTITCLAMTPPQVLSASAFDEETEDYQSIGAMTLYVPYGSKTAYEEANRWKDFGRIEELNYSFVKDHIYYKITGENKVCVTYKDSNYDSYDGRKVIPETVTNGDVTYTVTAIGVDAFRNCPDLISVKIPETVITIGNRSFKDCTSLTKITIPNSVTTIGMNAFEGCTALKKVVLGSGLKLITGSVFYACPALEEGEITCLATNPPTLTPSAFYNNQYSRTTVYVPEGCLADYQNHDVWQRFSCLREFISLDKALNVEGGTISFSTDEEYSWFTVQEGDRTYAQSGNSSVHNSISSLVGVVTVPEGGGTLTFDFLSLGDGQGVNALDKCDFSVDGRIEFVDGEILDWDTYEVELPAGTHYLRWDYIKDATNHPQGDYFAIDNVALTPKGVPGDANGDGVVNIQDALAVVNHILGMTPSQFLPNGADANGDEQITIADAVSIVNKILNKE